MNFENSINIAVKDINSINDMFMSSKKLKKKGIVVKYWMTIYVKVYRKISKLIERLDSLRGVVIVLSRYVTMACSSLIISAKGSLKDAGRDLVKVKTSISKLVRY